TLHTLLARSRVQFVGAQNERRTWRLRQPIRSLGVQQHERFELSQNSISVTGSNGRPAAVEVQSGSEYQQVGESAVLCEGHAQSWFGCGRFLLPLGLTSVHSLHCIISGSVLTIHLPSQQLILI
ncbi:hypothetical protein AOLI_G00214210, partial [Acnodon oligacanthus]